MKLMILDGNSMINRAFYGVRLLSTRDGLYTNAIYGFLNILTKLTDLEQPDALCVAFDLKGPTFRHDRYAAYKAQRKGMPEELAMQLPVMKQVLAAMNIPIYELEGYEADDLIGTAARICREGGDECVVVTGDKDSLQLIGGGVRVKLVATRMGQTTEKDYTTEQFEADYGFEPIHMIDLKALMGDASDNIPGVKGIGEKTAMDLIQRYRSIDTIYAGLDTLEVKDGVRTKLREGEEIARLSYELATIDTHAPILFRPADAAVREPDRAALYELFLQLEFNKLIEKYGLTPAQTAGQQTYEGTCESEIVTESARAAALLELFRGRDYVACLALPELDGVCVEYGGDAGGCAAVFLADRLPGYNDFLRGFFSPEIKKVTHNVKNLQRRLLAEELSVEGFVFDTALAAYLLAPTDGSYELEKLGLAYFNFQPAKASDYLTEGAFGPLADQAAALGSWMSHTALIEALYEELSRRLNEQGMLPLLTEVELPLCEVLAQMEHLGFRVDAGRLRSFGAALKERIDAAQTQIYELAGEEFNINSTKKLGEILFVKLGLPPVKKTKTGYSTNAEVLEKLRGSHPIVACILDYRMLTKLQSTYVEGLLKVIGPDGRIHTSFTMTVTATGRLSSMEPNLQNIPVRTPLGSELRRMFVAAPGCKLVDADYSQIELRVLAHISHDEVMQRAFVAGEDIHRVTASQVLGIPPEQVTPAQRSAAKAVNFGIVYGISDFSLSQDIGVSRYEARQYMDSYLEKYHGVRAYMKSIVEQAKRDGYVTTLMGRRREIPEIRSNNFNIRSFGERVALNTPIQGTAADIIKLAMVRVYRRLRAEQLRARLILQIHDELIIEAPEEEAERAAEILRQEMSGVLELSIPLLAEAKIGDSWYETK